MGKQGPCRHCGVTSTPLWRNGPPDKPVLCNACGSRWRTKGSLANYIPLRAREPFDSEELRVPKIKCISFKPLKPKEHKSHKKKQSNYKTGSDWEMQFCDQNFRKIPETDTSNRSSSGSAMSGSDSCVNVGTNDISDVTGSVQSIVCDPLVPSKKRTSITRPKASVEKLRKDLYSILHEEQASNLSSFAEEDLLYESSTPLDSFEIGYGSVLIKHANSKSLDEESEASSFPVDKSYIMNEGYSGSAFFPVNTAFKGIFGSVAGTVKLTTQATRENAKRDKAAHEKLNVLQDRDSPLCSADLNVIVNFEVFMKYLTYDERHQLIKYLPPIDISKPPESLKNMFTSSQLLETLSYFQQLLQEGTFDLSMSGAHAEECRILKMHVLPNRTKSQWLECYQKIQDARSKKIKGENAASDSQTSPGLSNSASLTRQHGRQNQNIPEPKSSRRVCRPGCMDPPARCSTRMDSSVVTKVTDDTEEFTDHDGTHFSLRRVFVSPPDRSVVLSPMQFVADSSDGCMLLDVPTGTSFPKAELLYLPWDQKTDQIGSPASVVDAFDLPSSGFSNNILKNG
ncbi:hypothetical protein Cni_G18325 [Canna indica]|uniref:GATA transcription factor 26 n=1 Tax=Canna indica TaxID=4628 RepID=A0AAQ3KP60_9LILI|nr:hypothetical protein Cni_G18325 [Canna indica]